MDKKTGKILFFLNHPAHFHLFKHIIRILRERGHNVIVYIVTKDVLEDLVKAEGWAYINLLPKGRRSSVFPKIISLVFYMFLTQWKLFWRISRLNIDLLVGSERTITHVGVLLGIRSLYVNEDDTISIDNYMTYPFATKVIVPEVTDRDKWRGKKINYNGNHELAYLRPELFRPDDTIVKEFNPSGGKYFLLRFVSLTASHDMGKNGMDDAFARKVISLLEGYGKVYISSERSLSSEFAKYHLKVASQHIHSVLYFSHIFIGDSLSMAMEASVLGVPSVRINDFVGRISVLNEMDEDYGLAFGYKIAEKEQLLQKLKSLLETKDLRSQWNLKRERLLNEKEDVVKFFVKTIESFVS